MARTISANKLPITKITEITNSYTANFLKNIIENKFKKTA